MTTENTDTPITRAEVQELIAQALSSLRVYVVESDITAAQQAVRTIVEQANF
jgi:hypothetical protein